MAHFTLMASPEHEKAGWRPCAVLQASTIETASRQAKALRDSGGLAFVSRPARFRMRRATRGEVRLMVAFFHSYGALGMLFGSEAERDGFFARRKKILLSFFMGLYIDPAALRRRYVDGGPFDDSAPSGSGGTVSEIGSSQIESPGKVDEKDEAPKEKPSEKVSALESEDEALAAEMAAEQEGEGSLVSEPIDALLNEASGDDNEFSEASGDAIDETNQEAALAAILASPAANDGGKSRDESFDLDIL